MNDNGFITRGGIKFWHISFICLYGVCSIFLIITLLLDANDSSWRYLTLYIWLANCIAATILIKLSLDDNRSDPDRKILLIQNSNGSNDTSDTSLQKLNGEFLRILVCSDLENSVKQVIFIGPKFSESDFLAKLVKTSQI